ncbi:MAG: DUF3343 domain-containing protein [Bacillota bacterium]|nr:DUF3343 domain-containing protein [Bacillota bacterium]
MALGKEWKAIFTFLTTTRAMAAEKLLREANIPGRLIPVPGRISAGCGMAWCAPIDSRNYTETILRKGNVAAEGIYELFM